MKIGKTMVAALAAMAAAGGLAAAPQDANALTNWYSGNISPGAKWHPNSGYNTSVSVSTGSPYYWRVGAKYCDNGTFISSSIHYATTVNLGIDSSRQANPWVRNEGSIAWYADAWTNTAISRAACGP